MALPAHDLGHRQASQFAHREVRAGDDTLRRHFPHGVRGLLEETLGTGSRLTQLILGEAALMQNTAGDQTKYQEESGDDQTAEELMMVGIEHLSPAARRLLVNAGVEQPRGRG